MAEPRDLASKISPKWLNRRTKPVRKWHQKYSTGKGSLASLLLPINPRLSRVSLELSHFPVSQVTFVVDSAKGLMHLAYEFRIDDMT